MPSKMSSMTIRELYEWALQYNAENMTLAIEHFGENIGTNTFEEEIDPMWTLKRKIETTDSGESFVMLYRGTKETDD